MDISNNINKIQSIISRSAQPSATLIAISKQQPEAKLKAALQAGQRVFGENRLQEAKEHWQEARKNYDYLELHFVGHLQSKKAAQAVEFFDVIHSVDRPSLAIALSKAMQKSDKRPDCFIQVNSGEEDQKSGISPQEAPDFIKRCREEWNLPVIGLMCLPPQGLNPVPHFAFLKKLADEHELAHLSMGMSSDWELALRMGATHIRVGSAIFGERG